LTSSIAAHPNAIAVAERQRRETGHRKHHTPNVTIATFAAKSQ
jgi:hypothetical protein